MPTANDPTEAALAVAMQQPLSLITADITLPQMHGWECLSRLKQIMKKGEFDRTRFTAEVRRAMSRRRAAD